jgi:hypothetical protein
MLKKQRKIIVMIVTFCFWMSMVGSASAGSFSDVSGSGTESAAIYKLNGLGIIEGYPDGTFGADKTITRAEFAKIACSIAGLANVAEGMSGTVSSYSDVAVDHWANGYINVAAAQGYMKGDPNGTFRPNDSITQAEVVTVYMRLLGYNDNLSGEWPSNYIAKAASLDILDDITFVSGQAATRGQVAVMGSTTLDQNVVQYVASDNYFEEKTKDGDTYTLLTQNFDGSTQSGDTLVTDIDLSDGSIRITLYGDLDNDEDTDPDTASYDLADNCVIGDNGNWSDIIYRFINFTVNEDNDVTSIIPKDYEVYELDPADVQTKTVNDGVEVTSLKLDDKKYECADEVQMIMSENEKDIFEDKANIGVDMDELMAADNIDFVLNDDGDVALIKVNAYSATKDTEHGIAKAGIVDSVNKKSAKITFKNTGSIDLDEDDSETYAIIKDGEIASLNDIEENDLVFDYTDDSTLDINYNYALDHMLVVSSNTVSGTFDALETTGAVDDLLKSVTIDDETYYIPGDYTNRDYLFSDDEGEKFTLNNDYESAESVLGEDVTAWLSPTGKVIAIASAASNSGKIYGVINDDDVSALVNGKITNAIEIMLADESLVTYAPDEDSEIWDAALDKYVTLDDDTDIGAGNTLCDDIFVQLTLNSDGYINQIRRVADLDSSICLEYAAADKITIYGDEDNETITINNQSYDVSGAAIFNISLDAAIDDDEVAVVSLSEFLDQADSTIINAGHVVAKIKDGEIQYLVFDNGNVLGSDNNVAMVVGSGTNADGKYVKLMTTGDAVKYTVKSGTVPAKGNLMNYRLVSGKVVNEYFTGWNYDGDEMTIDSISRNIFKIDGVNYAVNSDTLYFDFTDDDPVAAEKGDFSADDAVKVYQENAGDALSAIVLVNATTASTTAATPTASLATGEVAAGSTVTISTTTTGATIYYTTDGSTPTTSSTVYIGAITINSAMTIKALAVKDGKLNSSIATFAYTIPKSTDKTLSDLQVNGITVTGFAAGTKTYNVVLPAGTVIVPTVSATANDSKATAVVTQAAGVTGQASVLVTAEDLSTDTYTINFSVAKSTDTTLSDLQVDGGTVTGFAAGTKTYNVVLPAGTVIVPTVSATANDSKATAVVTQAASVTGQASVLVTAEDLSTDTYTINFSVAP